MKTINHSGTHGQQSNESINSKVDVMLSHQPYRPQESRPGFARRPRLARRRAGLTLVEMMVSVALTLMVVFALVRVFELLGDNVTEGRATIEVSSNLRTAAFLLREDLDGMTVTTIPPRSPAQDEGYYELLEGPGSDSVHYVLDANGQTQLVNLSAQVVDPSGEGFLMTPADTTIPVDSSLGDVDDILALTTRRTSQPFTGLITDPRVAESNRGDPAAETPLGASVVNAPSVAPTQLIESLEAEVFWWTQPVFNTEFDLSADIGTQLTNATGGLPQLYPNGTQVRSLHRRVRLIRPDLDLRGVTLRNLTEVASFLNTNDISVRVVRASGGYRVIANSLGDLSERHNRSYRLPASVGPDMRPSKDPLTQNSQLQRALLLTNGTMKDLAITTASTPFMMLRKGKDVVLSDVLGFDLQVWDPQAVVRLTDDGTAVTPSDPGYISTNAVNGPAGAYVDLGFGARLGSTSLPGQFSSFGDVRSKAQYRVLPANSATYCTWSSKYEYDGFDQDGNGIADQGSNNLDDNNMGGIDDPSEAETGPPYPHPLRGMKVSLRVMEPSTRQVRQTDVIHDFVAE